MAKIEFGLPEAGRSAKRDQTGAAQPAYQASKDAHVPVGAGQAEDLVGYSDADIGSIREFLSEGVAKGPHVRPAVVLVPVQAQSEGIGRARSPRRGFWRALSGGIQTLRRLFSRPPRSGSAVVQAKADETSRDMAVRGRSDVQR